METLKIKAVTSHLETLAPPSYQESYDNSGLLTGDPDWNVTGILVTLDCLEIIIDEAIDKKCNLIIAHHPIVFKGLKRLTGKTYVERTIIKAIKNDIAIYAIHTNLDNVQYGVNKKIAERLNLSNLKILAPKHHTLLKLITFIPKDHADKVIGALHEAGAGQVGNYKNCSFQLTGTGTFEPTEKAKPHIGEANHLEKVDEIKAEVILSAHLETSVLRALHRAHPYEEVAYFLTKLENKNQAVGAGMIGTLEEPLEPIAFLERLKINMNTNCIRYTPTDSKSIKTVAVCGGAGSFLLTNARAVGADAFVSADFKYHEFFDSEGKMLVADIGHYESEQFTKDLLKEVLEEKFPNFAVYFSKKNTNPISYL